MEIKRVLEFAQEKHKGKYRKDGKTPYIAHPMAICEKLYQLGITKTRYNGELCAEDYYLYSIALCHDLLEDTDTKFEDICKLAGNLVAEAVHRLTFKPVEGNPFAKAGYLQKVCEFACDPALVVKAVDRLCNVNDFFDAEDEKYARKYFHKADALFSTIYDRMMETKAMHPNSEKLTAFTNLWEEIIRWKKLLDRQW